MVQGLLRRVVNVTVVYMFILLVNLITIFGVSSGHKKNNIYLHTDYSIINVMGGISLRVTQQFSTPTGLNLILSALQAAPT